MQNFVRKQVKSFLRNRGLKIVSIDKYNERLIPVKDNWLKNMNIQTIIDVGAGAGKYISKIRQILPDPFIYAFEPVPINFEQLQARFGADDKVKTFFIALSTYKGEIDFFESENSPWCSSLLEMGDLHKTSFPGSKNDKKTKVPCDRLDNIFSQESMKPNIMLKLDVQGAEKIVLEGAEKMLDKVSLIYSEINFQELYKGAVLINDLMNYLEKYDFRLHGIDNVTQSLNDGNYLQGDAYFIKGSAIV